MRSSLDSERYQASAVDEPVFPQAVLASPRIGLVCDFLEENWPSMNLVADMLFDRLRCEHASTLGVVRICPPLRRRFGRLPGIRAAQAFNNADRLLNRFIDYRRALKPRAEEFDLFHLVDHSYSQLVHGLPSGRTVVTCHDLDTFRCVLDPARDPRPRWFRAMVERILSGFRKAAHVIAVSEATRAEILRFGLHPENHVTVISNGVHPSCSALPDPEADAQLNRLLPAVPEDAIWLLNVGNAMPRKRLDLLLRVFAAVKNSGRFGQVRLLRAGEPLTREHRELARELGVDGAIVEVGFLERNVLNAAYRRADLLLHTAEAEGFGLPLVEAMACGCRVIASDLPVLREVGGAGAVYRAVGDVEGWKDAVLAALGSRQEQEYQYHRERGFENAGRFSWSENASRTVRVYQQLLGKGLSI